MNSPIKLPELPLAEVPAEEEFADGWKEWPAHPDYYTKDQMRAYAEQAVRKARNAAIEDVACMICRRFDLNIPADLGPKLVNAIRSMKQEDGHG